MLRAVLLAVFLVCALPTVGQGRDDYERYDLLPDLDRVDDKVEVVGEGKVLLATIEFLVKRGVFPYRVSPPSGKGIDTNSIKTRVKNLFEGTSFEPEFVGSGPDVVAISENEWWIVECKGAGMGKPSTYRNSFDRALASAVSYYEETPPPELELAKNAKVFLGLALPDSTQYLKELERRVRLPLRRRLNLWVLLYEKSGEIRAIAPNEPY